MATNTGIANLALSHIGIGTEIQSLDDDAGQEAVACRRFFDVARNATLRDFPWSFARQFATLALVSDDPTETDEWAFSYAYPPEAVKIRRLQSGLRRESRQSQVKFIIGRSSAQKLIYTDLEDAQVEYTFKETNAQRFPDDFVLALSYRLAVYIAPRLSKGDPFNIQQRLIRLYLQELSQAQAASGNEGVPDEEPNSEFERSREGATDFFPPGQGGGTPFLP